MSHQIQAPRPLRVPKVALEEEGEEEEKRRQCWRLARALADSNTSFSVVDECTYISYEAFMDFSGIYHAEEVRRAAHLETMAPVGKT